MSRRTWGIVCTLVAALWLAGNEPSFAQETPQDEVVVEVVQSDDPFGVENASTGGANPFGDDEHADDAHANDPFGDREEVAQAQPAADPADESDRQRRAEIERLAERARQIVNEHNAASRTDAHSSRGLVTSSAAARQAADHIDAVLDKPLKNQLDYIETPLNAIMEYLSNDHDIPILFDRAALDSLAISKETEVSIKLRNVSLRSAIELIMREVEDLTYLVDNEVLLITTEDEAQQHLEVRVYRIDDLIRDPATGELDFDSLIDLLVTSVDQYSWMENGTGEGEVQPMQPGMLVISQTRHVHFQVEALLSTMREVKAHIEADAPPIDPQTASRPITKAYRIENVWGDKPEEARLTLSAVLKSSVAWKSENLEEQDAFIVVMPDRVIVRHIPAVQRQVEKTLEDLEFIKINRYAFGAGTSAGAGGVVNESSGGGFFNVEDSHQK